MNDRRSSLPPPAAGFILPVAFVLLVIVSAVCAVFLYAASQHGRAARRWHAADQCLLDAQSALEQVKYELTRSYLSSPAAAAGDLSWFQTWEIQSIGSNPV